MPNHSLSSPQRPLPEWSPEAFAIAAQAKALSGGRLEQLVVRLQRNSGRSRDTCWRFIIQHGLKTSIDYRRWTDTEFDDAREDLVKKSVEEVAKKLHRTPKAVRSALKRNHLNLREIRCDLFSVESLARALRVQRAEILYWIDHHWLQASIGNKGKKRFYSITPEALALLYRNHLQDLLKRGMPSQSLFEAYLEYCHAPKHTTGKQLLDVRRDKKERAAYQTTQDAKPVHEDERGDDEDDVDDEVRYRLNLEANHPFDEN